MTERLGLFKLAVEREQKQAGFIATIRLNNSQIWVHRIARHRFSDCSLFRLTLNGSMLL